MYLDKKLKYGHAIWNQIELNENPYMRKAGYDLVLRRDVTYSMLKRSGGQCVGGIDAKSSIILAKRPELRELIGRVLKGNVTR